MCHPLNFWGCGSGIDFQPMNEAFGPMQYPPFITPPPAVCSAALQFFDQYNLLLNSQNYVTRRQSLKVCVQEGGGGSGDAAWAV